MVINPSMESISYLIRGFAVFVLSHVALEVTHTMSHILCLLCNTCLSLALSYDARGRTMPILISCDWFHKVVLRSAVGATHAARGCTVHEQCWWNPARAVGVCIEMGYARGDAERMKRIAQNECTR